MSWPTYDEVHTALLDYAEFRPLKVRVKKYTRRWGLWRFRWVEDDGREFWFFHGSDFPRSYENALQVTACCLYLGAPVTDTVDAQHWYALCRRVSALEEGARLA